MTVSEGSPALQHSQHAGTCARPLSAPPGHPAHGHTTHAPAAGTRCAGGCHPPRGSCRSPQQPGWRVAAPGLPGGRPSPPATPQPPLVSIAPASWGGERWGVRGWGQQGHPAGFGETGTAGDGDVDFPPMLLFFSFVFLFFYFGALPLNHPVVCTQNTYPARAPAHDRVTSVPTWPYCTPGGTHRGVSAPRATPGVLLHAGNWEGLVPAGAGQWAALGAGWPGDTQCCGAAFREGKASVG